MDVPSILSTTQTLRLSDSPFTALSDILIPQGVTVTIEPGVVWKFAPKRTLRVRGRLIARGLPDKRIVFTRLNDTSVDTPSSNKPSISIVPQKARLVNGLEIRFGTLHLYHRGRWRHVCSQNHAWSRTDSNVACRELGFLEGNYTLQERAENDTHSLLFPIPNCVGNESSVLECPGVRDSRVGSNVCNLQELAGLTCWGSNVDIYSTHWSAIELYNSSLREDIVDTVNTRLNRSNSVLEFVEIMYAGINATGHQVAALSASPYPPELKHILVTKNAYDGINFTQLTGPALLTNVTVVENRGHGINISTAVGYVRLNEIHAEGNGGDGARVWMLPYHWPEEALEYTQTGKQLCREDSISSSPQFPFLTIAEHPVPIYIGSGTCSFTLNTDIPDQKITLALLEAVRDPLSTAILEIVDAWTNRILATWRFDQAVPDDKPEMANRIWWSSRGDMPLYRAVVSTNRRIILRYHWKKPPERSVCPFFNPCVRLVMQASVAFNIMNAEVEVKNSKFHNNIQRGLSIENPWASIRIFNSSVIGNGWDAGIKVMNGSSEIFINDSRVLENERCGVNITTAGGLRIINATRIFKNQGHGLDIWNPSWPRVTRSSLLMDPIETHVFHTLLDSNLYHGARFYNSCHTMNILMNNSIVENNGHSGIELVTCLDPYLSMNVGRTNLTVFNSTFTRNKWTAVLAQPVTNLIGGLLNSTFRYQQTGTVFMDNSEDFLLQRLYSPTLVAFTIRDCLFEKNRGAFVVNVRLCEGSGKQNMTILYNKFLDNVITQPGQLLNSRSSVHAVLIASSTNILVQRNAFLNRDSFREIGTRLTASNRVIDVSLNYWGTKEYWQVIDWQKVHQRVFERIFDNGDRFTLAQLKYYPVLKEPTLYTAYTSAEEPPYLHVFNVRTVNSMGFIPIGGRLNQQVVRDEDLPAGRYHVVKDIFVPFGTSLTIREGAQLYFENSVGLFAQGRLSLLGSASSVIRMAMYASTIWYPFNGTSCWRVDERDVLWEMISNSSTFNMTKYMKTPGSDAPITKEEQIKQLNQLRNDYSSFMNNVSLQNSSRLNVRLTNTRITDNRLSYRGRLEIRLPHTTTWGGVCAENFDWRPARLACSALGLVAHPTFWKVSRSEFSETTQTLSSNILLANILCHNWHVSLGDCEFDIGREDHDCVGNWNDLYIECHEPGWAGVRSTVNGETSIFRYTEMYRPGLLDYFTMEYTPGLQIDYNLHEIDHVKIDSSLSEGLTILHNDIWTNRIISNSEFRNNLGNGFLTRSPYLTLQQCVSDMNSLAGFAYDVAFSEQAAFRMRSSMYTTLALLKEEMSKPMRFINITGFNSPLPVYENSLSVHPEGVEFVTATLSLTSDTQQAVFRTELRTADVDKRQLLVISVLDFNPNITIENVTVYDGPLSAFEQNRVPLGWIVARELSRFPIVTSGGQLTIEIVLNGVLSNRLAFVVQARILPQSSARHDYYPPTMLSLTDSTSSGNLYGITLRHYNDPSDRDANIFLRHRRENIQLQRLQLINNKAQAVHSPSISRYNTDFYAPAYSEELESSARICHIFYQVNNCTFRQNKGGILLADHNHVEFSNNVWHYLWEGNIMEENTAFIPPPNVSTLSTSVRGGFVIDLPFVSKKFDWRYEENANHELLFRQNSFIRNRQFSFQIEGYMANVSIVSNQFVENICHETSGGGLVTLRGMEKRTDIRDNFMQNNQQCSYQIYFDIISQSESELVIAADINRNIITDNSCRQVQQKTLRSRNSLFGVLNDCATILISGVQNVTVHRNVINNPSIRQMNAPGWELAAGFLSSGYVMDSVTSTSKSLSATLFWDYLDARENYWGVTEDSLAGAREVKRRIFDFDNWNNFARVNFDNFLLEGNVDTSRIYRGSTYDTQVDFDQLGGRIQSDVTLPFRPQPYQIMQDITIMEGVTLRIDAGVQLQFSPSVGMLVLGRIVALGSSAKPIIFEPIALSNQNAVKQMPISSTNSSNVKRVRRSVDVLHLEYTIPSNSIITGNVVRLEKNGIRLVAGREENEGFLQFFNSSVNRWDHACDVQLSVEVGMVLCRELGVHTYNALIYENYLFDYHYYGYDNPFIMKYIWMESYMCQGDELSRAQCVRRMNYDANNCNRRRGYVFLRCARSNLVLDKEQYWGGIRIVQTTTSYSNYQISKINQQSMLEYVTIRGAGVLHGRRVAAVQTWAASPRFSFVSVKQCAWNGFDLLAPREVIYVTNTSITDNLGYGYGMLVLNGDSTSHTNTPFTALSENNVPYDAQGMLDACSPTKKVVVKNRLLIYYKYSYETRACTKLFISAIGGKKVAVRFLQVKLYYDPFTKNSIELFNGNLFNVTELIKELTALNTINEEDRSFTYTTSDGYDIMGLHIHASPAKSTYGFIAEVVTLPLSAENAYPDLEKQMEHLVQDCEFTANQGGAINYAGVGEINPDLRIYYNRFMNNGLAVLNLTSESVIRIHYQNGRGLDISNNYVFDNRGTALQIYLYASSLAKAGKVNITNNILTRGSHGGVLWTRGNHFTTITCSRNFLAHNDCEERDVIAVHGILMAPFSNNFIFDNRGSVVLNISGLETLSTESRYEKNGFSNNEAMNYTRHATVFVGNTKNIFRENYFRNVRNNFEMVAGNNSIIKTIGIPPGASCPSADRYCVTGWTQREEWNQCVCYRIDKLTATNNWWGEESVYHAAGKIWDKSDDPYLFSINIDPAYKDNSSVLKGGIYCPPTWEFKDDHCYWYFGAPLSFNEAKHFCLNEMDSILVDSRNRVNWLTQLMSEWQNNYPWINYLVWNSRIWVQSDLLFPDECSSLRNFWLEGFPCDKRLPFVCQKSPYGIYDGIQVEVLIILGIIFLILLLLLILLLVLWHLKSKRRYQQRVVRKQELQRYVATKTLSQPSHVPAAGDASTATSILSPYSTSSSTFHISHNGTKSQVGKTGPMRLPDARETINRSQLPVNSPPVGNQSTLLSSISPRSTSRPTRPTQQHPTADNEIPSLLPSFQSPILHHATRPTEAMSLNKPRMQRPKSKVINVNNPEDPEQAHLLASPTISSSGGGGFEPNEALLRVDSPRSSLSSSIMSQPPVNSRFPGNFLLDLDANLRADVPRNPNVLRRPNRPTSNNHVNHSESQL